MKRLVAVSKNDTKNTQTYQVYPVGSSSMDEVCEGPPKLYGSMSSDGEYDFKYKLDVVKGRIIEAVPVPEETNTTPSAKHVNILYPLFKVFGRMPEFISYPNELKWLNEANPIDYFFYNEFNPFGTTLNPNLYDTLSHGWWGPYDDSSPYALLPKIYTSSPIENTIVKHILPHLQTDLSYGHTFTYRNKLPSHVLLNPALAMMVEKKYIYIEDNKIILNEIRTHESNIGRCLGVIKQRWTMSDGFIDNRVYTEAEYTLRTTSGKRKYEEDVKTLIEKNAHSVPVMSMADEQLDALKLSETRPISGIFGGAGSGKTTILQFFINKHPNTLCFAPTNMAKRALRKKHNRANYYIYIPIYFNILLNIKFIMINSQEGEDPVQYPAFIHQHDELPRR